MKTTGDRAVKIAWMTPTMVEWNPVVTLEYVGTHGVRRRGFLSAGDESRAHVLSMRVDQGHWKIRDARQKCWKPKLVRSPVARGAGSR